MTSSRLGKVASTLGILFMACTALARDVNVRLYSADPPSEVTLLPRQVSWKSCETCRAQSPSKQLSIVAQGSRLLVDGLTVPQMALTGSYELRGTGRASLNLQIPLRVRAEDGRLVLVATMPLEAYVAAVVAGEAGGIASGEALKAMAVAARTYAVHFSDRHRLNGFDVCDSTHCQTARFGGGDERVRNAVAQTAGELLWYRGAAAASYYHRNCGGQTEDAHEVWPGLRVDYLIAHNDPYCSGADDSTWTSTITSDEMVRVLSALPNAPDKARTIVVESRTPAGRNRSLRIIGGNGTSYVVDEQRFRFTTGRVLGWDRIRSDQFEVQSTSAGFRFLGHGAGHGVGMCQRGATNMGKQGKTYREILAFYYPGTKLGLTAQRLAWKFLRGERAEMLSMADDAQVLEAAERAIPALERIAGLSFITRPQLRVYPTVETFRDATGEPGWVAASTHGDAIRLQPTSVLRQKQVLDSTLRHELLHVLVEQHARADTPRWLREGLVLYLSGTPPAAAIVMDPKLLEKALTASRSEGETRDAYAAAHRRTRELIARYGQPTVMSWLEKGLPAEVLTAAQLPR